MEKVFLNKKVYSKNQYTRVIDTKFSQLASSISTQNISDRSVEVSTNPQNTNALISKFFSEYNELFLQIPKFGDINSHEFLIKTSTEFIGFNPVSDEVQALVDEINILQQTNLELNEKLLSLDLTGSLQ